MKLHIANLLPLVSERQLRELLAEYGAVLGVELGRTRHLDRKCGVWWQRPLGCRAIAHAG